MIHVLTVDSSVARLYEVTGSRPPLREIVDFGNRVAGLHERDLVSSRPGRSYNRSSGIHQAYEPARSAKQRATHRWLEEMCPILGRMLGDAAGGLLVVASPRLQAELQPLLSKTVRGKERVSFGRNLSGLPAAQLAARLGMTIAALERRLGEPGLRHAVARARRFRTSVSVT